MQLVSDFLAWKMATGFTLAAELVEPNAMSCVGITRDLAELVIAPILRQPTRFTEPVWLAADQIGDEVKGLLPRGRRELTSARIGELGAWFGAWGRFPAVHVASGVVGG